MRASPAVYNLIVHPRFFTKWFGERILRPFFDLSRKKTLEFGCGTGVNSLLFDPKYYLGVDIDEQRIGHARKLYPNHRFEVVGQELSGIDEDSYDVILISGVLHHLTDPQIQGYWKRFLRILKPDGVLIIFEPYLVPKSGVSTWIMNFFDEGKYIRSEDHYLGLFAGFFQPRVLTKFRLPNLYTIVLIMATRLKSLN